MIEIFLAGARWLQLAAAALLCGLPAFALYGLTREAGALHQAWLKRALLAATALALIAAAMMLLAQSAEMSGDIGAAFDPETVWSVASGTYFGTIWSLRLVLLALTGMLIALFPVRSVIVALAGGTVAASVAFLGHGSEGGAILGLIHQVADVLHVLAASVWIGALVMLSRLLRAGNDGVALRGLTRFSGVGSIVVATLLLTGVINALVLTLPRPFIEALTTPYAIVLALKIALFAAMLMFAAFNRFVLTPRFGAEDGYAAGALRRSIAVESAMAVLVLAAAAALGVMEPPSAG